MNTKEFKTAYEQYKTATPLYQKEFTIAGIRPVAGPTRCEVPSYEEEIKDCKPGDHFLINGDVFELVCYLLQPEGPSRFWARRIVVKGITSEENESIAMGRVIGRSNKISRAELAATVSKIKQQKNLRYQAQTKVTNFIKELNEEFPGISSELTSTTNLKIRNFLSK